MRGAWIALLLLVASSVLNAESSAAHDILTGIVTPRDEPVAFIEYRANEMLARPLELAGFVRFGSDGELVKIIDTPFAERVHISDTGVRVERAGRELRLPIERDPGARAFFLALRALLEGDHATVAEHFALRTTRSGDDWRIEFVPREAMLGRYLDYMSVTGRGSIIDRIRTVQSEAVWQEMRFDVTAAQ